MDHGYYYAFFHKGEYCVDDEEGAVTQESGL